jgi:hypothetical protein
MNNILVIFIAYSIIFAICQIYSIKKAKKKMLTRFDPTIIFGYHPFDTFVSVAMSKKMMLAYCVLPLLYMLCEFVLYVETLF